MGSTTAGTSSGSNNDVAQILGGSSNNGTSNVIPRAFQTSNPLYYNMSSSNKSGSLVNLLTGSKSSTTLASATLPPIVPKVLPQIENNKQKRNPARKWVWASFTSSARLDGAQFRHWVRAGVEYPDYPYARFDVHLDNIEEEYSSKDYEKNFSDTNWTKSETDAIIQLVCTYELRWPVIYDNWKRKFGSSDTSGTHKQMEELQHRYYTIAAILTKARITSSKSSVMVPEVHCAGMGSANTSKILDVDAERMRREQAEFLWNRSKQEEEEEEELLKEYKQVELQLRKLKKSGAHLLAAAAESSSTANDNNNKQSKNNSTNPDVIDKVWRDVQKCSTTPVPTPGTPYLQSARLTMPRKINKTSIKHLNLLLEELKVPTTTTNQIVPTKRMCDTYDKVRQQGLALLILQKLAIQKETLVGQRQIKVQKLQQQLSSYQLNASSTTVPPTNMNQMIPPTKTPTASSTKTTIPTPIRRGPPILSTGAIKTTTTNTNVPNHRGTMPIVPTSSTNNPAIYNTHTQPPIYMPKMATTQNRSSVSTTSKKGDKANTSNSTKKSSQKRKSTSKKQQQQQQQQQQQPHIPIINSSNIPSSMLHIPATSIHPTTMTTPHHLPPPPPQPQQSKKRSRKN